MAIQAQNGRVKQPVKKRGRPPGEAAVSCEIILDAVHDILMEKSLRDLTIEEVAARAKVGKPTLYKWWPSKAALVLDMLEHKIMCQFNFDQFKTAEQALRTMVSDLIRLLNGFFGKIAADLIAEGQSDPALLKEYRDRYLTKRRYFSRDIIQKAQNSGEFRKDINPELLIDLILGPIYYRLLLRHQKLDQPFGHDLINHLLAYVKL